jgi:hypothetical protein
MQLRSAPRAEARSGGGAARSAQHNGSSAAQAQPLCGDDASAAARVADTPAPARAARELRAADERDAAVLAGDAARSQEQARRTHPQCRSCRGVASLAFPRAR